MDIDKQFKLILQKTKILKSPKHRLATFGQTRIDYFFLSEIKGFKDRSRLRRGVMTAEKPQIVTPDFLKNRFEGFGSKSQEFGDWLGERYGAKLQGLEYKFKNSSQSTNIEYSPLKILTETVKSRLTTDEENRSAIIQGPDSTWGISLMKYIVDECLASFTENLRELDEHGFFDTPEKTLKVRRKEIEQLFSKARQDRKLVPFLGTKLRQYGLFKEYEERFFELLKG